MCRQSCRLHAATGSEDEHVGAVPGGQQFIGRRAADCRDRNGSRLLVAEFADGRAGELGYAVVRSRSMTGANVRMYGSCTVT